MDALKSLVQPLMGGSSSVVDGMKLVVLGGTVETARRVSSSAWSHFVNSFFLTAHFCEEEQPYDWLVLWLSRRPEWQRSREFETTTRGCVGGMNNNNSSSSSFNNINGLGGYPSSGSGLGSGLYGYIGGKGGAGGGALGGGGGGYSQADKEWEEAEREWERERGLFNGYNDSEHQGHHQEEEDGIEGLERPKTRIVFQPTYDTTHTIYFRGHWLRVKRGRKLETGSEMISVSVVARSNTILKHLILQAKKEYESSLIHRIQIYLADTHQNWRLTSSRPKRPLSSIVLNPGIKELILSDAIDFLQSEKWYMDRGIPFRRGYLLWGVPGSGKSSLIHALAGRLGLDVYVVSLSAGWVSDGALMGLMGRVPGRCVLLLEDLDAAFVRSTNREEEEEDGDYEREGEGVKEGPGLVLPASLSAAPTSSSSFSSSSLSTPRRSRYNRSSSHHHHNSSHNSNNSNTLSPTNTLSLSGLLNALDGVAASEGRLLFATTNHLDRLDPALSRPGRMDVWIEFKNASKWQAEALFRNFFPCDDVEDVEVDVEVEEVEVGVEVGKEGGGERKQGEEEGNGKSKEEEKKKPQVYVPSVTVESTGKGTSLWSLASSATSLLTSSSSSSTSTPMSLPPPPPHPLTQTTTTTKTTMKATTTTNPPTPPKFGSTNTTYLPPSVEESVLQQTKGTAGVRARNGKIITNANANAKTNTKGNGNGDEKGKESYKPLDKKTLEKLAKEFADGVPEEEFSVASLQGYLLKHKAQPYQAASSIQTWVNSERHLRETLQKEKERRELKDRENREKRRREMMEKAEERKEREGREREMERIKGLLAEKEKEEELEKMKKTLREKEDEGRKRKEGGMGDGEKEGEGEEKEESKQSSASSSTWGELV